MDQEQLDPLAQLDSWGRKVERKLQRKARWQRLRRSLRPGNRTAAVIVVLLVIAGCGGAARLWRNFEAAPVSYPTAAVPSGIAATSGVGSVVKGPFEGTPAETFPEGEAGLVMPAAQATGAWSEQEVAAALEKTRKALIAAHLDHRMLVDHDPSAFLELLSPIHRDEIGKDIQAGHYGVVAVHIAKDAKLAQDKPRVSGRMTFRAGMWGEIPVLELISNYVWVYPFEVPSGWAGKRIVVVHDEVHWYFPKDKSVIAGNRGMNIGKSDGYWDLMDCTESNRGFTAPYKGHDASAKPHPTSTEPESAYFQPDHTLDIEHGCVT